MDVSFLKDKAQGVRNGQDAADDTKSTLGATLKKSRPKSSRMPLGGNTLMGGIRDDLAMHYTQMADDATSAPKRKEAAMLLAAAEDALDQEDGEAALTSANQAVEMFREIGDAVALADALVVICRTQDFMALAQAKDPDEALRTAEGELSICKAAGNKRGEASMLLAVAEIKTYMRGGAMHLTSAMEAAQEALSIFTESGDKKSLAQTHLALVNVFFAKGKYKDCEESAREAMKLAVKLGSDKLKAKAYHGISLSYVIRADYDNMISNAKEALALYQKLGMKRQESFELAVLAQFYLMQERPAQALPPAHDGLLIARSMERAGKAPEAFLQLLVVEGLVGIGRSEPALKEAKKGLKFMQDSGDKRGVVFGLEVVMFSYMQLEQYEDALAACEDALEAVREAADKRVEINLEHSHAQIYLKLDQPDKAVKAMKEAMDLAQELEDTEEEAMAQRMLSDIYIFMGRGREAISAATESQSLFQEISDAKGEASAKVLEAFAHFSEGDNDKCISVSTDAQEICEEEEDTEGAALALRLICETALEDKDFEKALQAAQRRQELWEDVGNKLEIALAMHLVAVVQVAADNAEDGYQMALDAQKLAQDLGNKRLEAAILMEMCSAQVVLMARAANPDSPDFIEALKKALIAATQSTQIALKYCNKSYDKALKARACTWKAQLLHNGAQPAQSMKMAVYAEKLWRALYDDASVSEVLTLQAHAKFTMGDKDGALELANQALELAKEVGASDSEAAAQAAIDRITYVAPVVQQQIPAEYLAMMQGGDAAAAAQGGGAEAVVSVAKAAPQGLDPLMTKTKLMRLVKDLLAGDADDFENDSPFMEAGMDSLSSVQMMTEVSKEFQMSMSPSLIFDFPTVRAMTDHLVEESKSLAEAAY